jgi:hypothetical protein
VTTSLWRGLTTVQIDVFVAANVFWKTAFNLLTRNARTAAVYLLQRDHLLLLVAMVGGSIALVNVAQKAHVNLKRSRAFIAVLCFIPEAYNTMLHK